MTKVTEEQRSLEKKWQLINMLKSRRALGGASSLPKISPVNSPRMSHFMLKNPKNRKPTDKVGAIVQHQKS
jgi:hypothetical protein